MPLQKKVLLSEIFIGGLLLHFLQFVEFVMLP